MTRILDKLFDNDGKAITFIMVGKSFRGKSHFLRYLLIDRLSSKKLKFGLVFTSTKWNNDYTGFLPDNRIYEGYNEDVLKRYYENLKKIKREKGDVEPNFIVFDDLVGILNGTDFFNNFITTCRHLNMSVFIAVQYVAKKGISTVVRQQTTHCLMFKSSNKNNTMHLYDAYGQLFDSFKEFKNHFDCITRDKYVGMLYLENEDDIDKNYVPIRAPPPENIPNDISFDF
jgi:hypothetical protein